MGSDTKAVQLAERLEQELGEALTKMDQLAGEELRHRHPHRQKTAMEYSHEAEGFEQAFRIVRREINRAIPSYHRGTGVGTECSGHRGPRREAKAVVQDDETSETLPGESVGWRPLLDVMRKWCVRHGVFRCRYGEKDQGPCPRFGCPMLESIRAPFEKYLEAQQREAGE